MNKAFYVLAAGNVFRRWAIAFALGVLGLSAYAQNVTYTTSAFTNPRWDLSGANAIASPGGSVSLPSRPPPSVPGAAFHGNTMFFTDAGSMPSGRWQSDVPIPGGNGRKFSPTATVNIPRPSAATAIARFAGKLVPIVVYGTATYELMRDLGFFDGGDTDQDGYINWMKQDPQDPWCGVAPCYEYRVSPAPYARQTPETSCTTAIPYFNQTISWTYLGYNEPNPGAGEPAGSCRYRATFSTGQTTDTRSVIERRTRTPDTIEPALIPATEQDLADKIAAQSGWPSRSNEALRDAVAGGQPVQAPLPTLSGPSSTAGGTETKQEAAKKADGTPGQKITTSVTTHNHTYNNNTVNTTNVITTTITYNWSDGTTETETETEQNEPEKPDDPCESRPDSVACAELDTPEGEVPKTTKALTYMAESLGFGGGVCPADIVRTIGGKSVTVFSYAKGCEWLSSYVKPLVLMLSAWIAFLILMPGGRTE